MNTVVEQLGLLYDGVYMYGMKGRRIGEKRGSGRGEEEEGRARGQIYIFITDK